MWRWVSMLRLRTREQRASRPQARRKQWRKILQSGQPSPSVPFLTDGFRVSLKYCCDAYVRKFYVNVGGRLVSLCRHELRPSFTFPLHHIDV